MTVGEVSKALAKFPPQLQLVVSVDQQLTVLEATGDRISGYYSGLWDVSEIAEDEVFAVGLGYLPVIVLEANEEY